ncbi:unnamed protein product [Tuber melanosporum]|uniref:mRNA 3'-end-processing protein RNA14 n=1 Tax=Tuber melanosporum (strain Mel28) TaxID=656061 RepID=D5GH73_TUBMM|nr:uncharacterized protein GSTUM_00007778001 [Tuber melanosporum]CAZ83898.1 unnamed protein product [Tuber melanosporum]
MAEHNNSDDADAAFLNALKAEQEMAEAGQKASELGGESELIGNEPEEGAEKEATFRELSDQVEKDNHLQINESKDTSTAASGATSLLPGVAVASPDGGPSSVNGSAMGDPAAQPLLNANMGAGPSTQESSAISSPSVTPVGALVPDENNNDSAPHTLSVTTPTAGSNNNDSLPVSSTTPVNAPSTAVPVQSPVQKGNANVANKRKRLPQDIVGQLEDRIAEDPRGDIDAWLALIEEHRKKGKFDDVRAVYERFFVVFPAAADQWISYVKMELANNELQHVERIFQRSLFNVPNVELWSMYLDYIRRRNNLTTDTGGKARAVVNQSYEFVLNNVGCDREAGRIWTEYIQFVKSAPGNVGGSGWQDQQKMDSLRKVYQKAVTMPVQGVEQLWREYDQFEQGLNKLTARKFLQERSPMFMTARGCLIELSNITKGLRRDTLSRLPPAPGYEGYEDYTRQVELWKKWIQWEKGDPLVLAKEDPASLSTRIIYVFKQALMALRFWPEIWFDAAEWCFANGMDDQGVDFLNQGMVANPESCLLHFKYAERLEATTIIEGGEEALIRKGQLVRKPYDDLLNMLYEQVQKIQRKEKEELARIEDAFELTNPRNAEDDDEDDDPTTAATRAAKDAQVATLREGTKAQLQVMTKTISAVWINLMRAMRRVQGHGKVNEALGGSRQIFADARRRGKINSDVYVASALIEYHCYKDPAALKIFERGMRLFPEDENFALEYLKHLVAINDITNARAVFETFVGRVTAEKARKVYEFFYDYEAHYGELGQVYKMEKRMSELYPTDPYISRFSSRYAYRAVDPCSFLAVVSPAQQCKPKSQAISPPVPDHLPRDGRDYRDHPQPPPTAPANGRTVSPKRPANEELSDSSEHQRPRKLHRPDSPLKGAAGRRLDQQKRYQQNQRQPQQHQPLPMQMHQPPAPTQLPDLIMYLLSILPGADKYQAARFRPEAMVGLLGNINLPRDVQANNRESASIHRSVPQGPRRQY